MTEMALTEKADDPRRLLAEVVERCYAELRSYARLKMCPTASLCYDSNSDEGIPLNNWRNHVPPVGTVSLTLGGRFFDEKLTLGGRVNYTGERVGIPPAAKDDRKWNYQGRRWHAYTTVDAFASYKFNDTVTLDIAAENVFDTFYTDALAMANQPGPGRTIRLNMTAKF